MDAKKLIRQMIKQVKEAGYEPFALWYSKTDHSYIVTTNDYDLRIMNYRLIKTYKQ